MAGKRDAPVAAPRRAALRSSGCAETYAPPCSKNCREAGHASNDLRFALRTARSLKKKEKTGRRSTVQRLSGDTGVCPYRSRLLRWKGSSPSAGHLSPAEGIQEAHRKKHNGIQKKKNSDKCGEVCGERDNMNWEAGGGSAGSLGGICSRLAQGGYCGDYASVYILALRWF
ncbi:hypothetical protein NDU88_003962 [Pleurodeles waltl]|uniref:Uncharacterized protein n=1 Tax=Pleurodeles waltl TaxID=8319 RepID=A0AAV7QB76_PLEWA|nr:hypothetical protein NDU88_003962 [Pleurodeles waltl]